MTEDIWAEKPLREGYPAPHYQQRAEFYYYPVVEMDVWLEKLKERYDIYVKQYRNMTEHALGQQKKLEAVKKLKDELDEQIGFFERASRTHGTLLGQKIKHELQKTMSKQIGKILEGDQ